MAETNKEKGSDKILNIFMFMLGLSLLYLSTLNMYMNMEKVFILICYIAFAMAATARLLIHHKTERKTKYILLGTLSIVFLYIPYLKLVSNSNPEAMFRPLFILPLLMIAAITFWKAKKYLAIPFLTILGIPVLACLIDYTSTQDFFKTCEMDTPAPEYNAIYLPKKFFHKGADNELYPNVEVVDSYPSGYLYFDDPIDSYHSAILAEAKSNIVYLFKNCGHTDDKKTTKDLIDNGNIVLCMEYDIIYNCQEFAEKTGKETCPVLLQKNAGIVSLYNIKQVGIDLDKKDIVSFYELSFKGLKRMAAFFYRYKEDNCRYSFANESIYTYLPTSEETHKKYIKPIE
ncbi:MAG: hypothetical protein LBR70_03425 [Lactobacillaceae bacterium]|nr:hypothetical protein [Lactobacillaceae bacterium]